jgi:hypothetical protein
MIANAAKWLDPDDSVTPWCGCFRHWIAFLTATPSVPEPYRAASWMALGRPVSTQAAIPGDTVILKNHVAIVQEQMPDSCKMRVVGGNQSDAVTVMIVPYGKILAARSLIALKMIIMAMTMLMATPGPWPGPPVVICGRPITEEDIKTADAHTSAPRDVIAFVDAGDPPTARQIQSWGAVPVAYLSAGSIEDWRPGAKEWMRAHPDAMGRPMPNWPGERYLKHNHPATRKWLLSRLKKIKAQGWPAVNLDNLDAMGRDHYDWITAQCKKLGLTVWARHCHPSWPRPSGGWLIEHSVDHAAYAASAPTINIVYAGDPPPQARGWTVYCDRALTRCRIIATP